MKKTLFTLLGLCIVCLLPAQLSFTKKAQFDYYNFLTQSFFTYNNEQVAYTMEIVNDKDIKFTIISGDLDIKRTFTITDCVLQIYDEFYELLLAGIMPIEDYSSTYTHLTQTLFNEDEKFEVVRLKVEVQNDDFTITGAEVVSEDGIILGELPEEMLMEDYYLELSVLTIEDNTYICVYNWDEDMYHAYSIDNAGNKSSPSDDTNSLDTPFMSKVSSSKVYPNPVINRNNLTIELDKAVTDINSYIEIIDMRGRKIIKKPIKANTNKVSISTKRLKNGQYLYRIISNGNSIDTGKVIVK
ncbi:MAG: T9SS type A sorting domain-containing protein [Candidatus Azobacteroides sp.]|nr:T9SS type A sorting domain-containing protein [Candidatus Azobacteroides sp.]